MVSRASLSCESRDTNCLSVNDPAAGTARWRARQWPCSCRASNVVLERAQVSPANRKDLESDKLEELLVSAEVLLHVLDDASLVVAGKALEELCVLLQFLLAVLVQEQQHAAQDGLLRFSVSRVP